MENIKVIIHLKPSKESENKFKLDKPSNSNNTYTSIINTKTKEVFKYESITPSSTTNESLFNISLKSTLNFLLKGINISLFSYGPTSSGKSYTIKGKNNQSGLIYYSLKELFSLLDNKNIIDNYTIKISYFELYNEQINDLLNSNQKNLEIKESLEKGIFVNKITEINIKNLESVNQVLNGVNSSNDIKNTKTHYIFRINIEYTKINENKDQIYSSQLNLIELSGSENITKLKSEGFKNKENLNCNKSLLSFMNLITNLNINHKGLIINYRESKLTKLFQKTFNGNNTKIIFICNIVDDNIHYNENLNTFHFANKCKNIKINIKVNDNIDNNKKIMNENDQLKNKIKYLEDLVNEKKEKTSILNETNNNSIPNQLNSLLLTATKNNNNSNSELNKTTTKNQIISLEKELNVLKRLLINNKEELGEDLLLTNAKNNNQDIYSMNSSTNNNTSVQNFNLLNGLMQSGYKTHFSNMNPFTSTVKRSDNFPENLTSNYSAYRAGIYNLSKIRGFTQPNPYSKTDNKLLNYTSCKENYSCNYENSEILAENEELKKNIYELKKNFYENIKEKDNQIKILNENYSATLENCEKLIKEAEDNYMNLKLNYDQSIELIKEKDKIISSLNNQNVNMENSINYYKEECNKNKDVSYVKDLEDKYNLLVNQNNKLNEEKDTIINKLKSENDTYKNDNSSLKNKFNLKNTEYIGLKEKYDITIKSYEREINKLKNEIKNYKSNSLSSHANNTKTKENAKDNVNNNCIKNKCNKLISDYEQKIDKLKEQNNDYKSQLEKISKTQILEYQKLLEESFVTIENLNSQLVSSQNKIDYYESIIKSNKIGDDLNVNVNEKLNDENKTPIKIEEKKDDSVGKEEDDLSYVSINKPKKVVINENEGTDKGSGKIDDGKLFNNEEGIKVAVSPIKNSFLGKKRKSSPKIKMGDNDEKDFDNCGGIMKLEENNENNENIDIININKNIQISNFQI